MKTMIGMMAEWSKRPVPTTIFGGSNGQGGKGLVWEMMGVDAAMNSITRLANQEMPTATETKAE